MPTTNAAWVCVQSADLLRRVEEIVLETMTALGTDLHAGVSEDVHRSLSADESSALKQQIAAIHDLTDQLQHLTERLPDDDSEISYTEIREGAATELADGILDPRAALLAIGVLDAKAGWAALADALETTDVRTAWDDVTLDNMLARSRGADHRKALRVIRDAGLSPGSTFPECSPEDLQRLAASLARHARGST